MSEKRTIVVNLFAGPGAGKSTCAASIFSKLKWKGIDCELVPEFAKELVWECRDETFKDQIYLFGKQHHRMQRVIGKVDVVVTDSPFLLAVYYDQGKSVGLKELGLSQHNKLLNLNLYVARKKDYSPNGRIHTEEEAHKIDDQVSQFLLENGIDYWNIEGTDEGAEYATELVDQMLTCKELVSNYEAKH